MADVMLGVVRQLADGGAYLELEELPGFRVGPCSIADACSQTLAAGDRVIAAGLGFGNYVVVDRIGAPQLATRTYADNADAATLATAVAAAAAHADNADAATLTTAVAAAAAHADNADAATLAAANSAAKAGDAALVPPGAVGMFAGAAAPAGWLWCDGASVLRGTWPALFAAIGTVYGAADGTHFSVPNLVGAFPMGVAAGAPGGAGGSALHTHSLSSAGWAQITVGGVQTGINRVTATAWTANVTATASTAAAAPAENTAAALGGSTDTTTSLPPYTGVGFIIKT